METKYRELHGHDFYKAALSELADAKTREDSKKLDVLIDVLSALLKRQDPIGGWANFPE